MEPFDLNAIHVKSPCTVPWETMTGDERTRFCAQCKLNVFHLSDMTKAEAEALIQNKEGRLCVRYAKRADGTVLTRDCGPVRAARSRFRRRAALIAASMLVLTVQAAFWFQRKAVIRNINLSAQAALWLQRTAVIRNTNLSPQAALSPSDTVDRMRQSKLYEDSVTVQTVVDWTENQIHPKPDFQAGTSFHGFIYE